MKTSHLAILTATIIGVAATGWAAGHAKMPAEIAARHGQMQMISLNMGIVGNMARGKTDYDAAAAQAAADDLATIGTINQAAMWPEGTSVDDHESSRALPTVWSDQDGFDAAWSAFGDAATAFAQVAGGGPDAMRSGLGGVGRTCGTCHDTYRQDAN